MGFYEGFEKRAYDYAYEVDEARDYAKRRYQDEPIKWSKALGGGAAVGSGLGALAGILSAAKGKRGLGALGGALAGGGAGALMGAGAGAMDRFDIAEQQNIMGMGDSERDKYLASKEREREFHRRERQKRYYRDDY